MSQPLPVAAEPAKPILRRNKSALRLERRMLARDGSQAVVACPWCGCRAASRSGHPRGANGQPVCVEAKRKALGLW